MTDLSADTSRRAFVRAGLGIVGAAGIAPVALADPLCANGSHARWDVVDRTGTKDASAAFTTLAGANALHVPPGVYKISASITLSVPVMFDPGAVLMIAPGVTVTFAAAISAPVVQVFACKGTARVVFLVQPVEAYPEWWGAQPGNPAFDSLPALLACMTAAQRTRLSPALYYVSSTLVWNLNDRALIGSAPGYGGSTVATIVLTGANAALEPIFHFGASAVGVARGQYCQDVAFSRSGTARKSSSGDAQDGVTGVVYTWTTNSEMRRCRVYGSPIGFHVTQVATCNLIDCNVVPAASSAADICIAYLFGGYNAYPGFVGANGSLRAEGNTAFDFPPSLFSAHTLVYGLPADTWLEKPEGSGGKYGIVITGLDKASMARFLAGATSGLTISTQAQSCQDITINNARMDGATNINFYFAHLNDHASINVNNPYAATTATNFALTHIGRVSLNGGEIIGATPSSAALGTGLDANSVQILSVTSFFRDCRIPLRITSCTGAKIEPDIYNLARNAEVGVQLYSVTRSLCRPTIKGNAGAFANGITMDAATTLTSVDGSRIDPQCFTIISAAHKVLYDGKDVRISPGTNIVTGVTA